MSKKNFYMQLKLVRFMSLKEAKDLFSEVGKLYIDKSSMIHPVLALNYKNEERVLTTRFYRDSRRVFCAKHIANEIAYKLGFQPTDTTEVTAWLIEGKTVMIKVYNTNARPKPYKQFCPLDKLLKLNYEIGWEEDYAVYYIHHKVLDEFFKKGDEITGLSLSLGKFISFTGSPYKWKAVVKDVNVKGVACICNYIGDLRLSNYGL